MNRCRLYQRSRTRSPILGQLGKVQTGTLSIGIERIERTVPANPIRELIGTIIFPCRAARVGRVLLGGFSRLIVAEMANVPLDTSSTRTFLLVWSNDDAPQRLFPLRSGDLRGRMSCAEAIGTKAPKSAQVLKKTTRAPPKSRGNIFVGGKRGEMSHRSSTIYACYFQKSAKGRPNVSKAKLVLHSTGPEGHPP
jgi:hypothetical protein